MVILNRVTPEAAVVIVVLSPQERHVPDPVIARRVRIRQRRRPRLGRSSGRRD
jgi:hypothetical protein